MKNKRNSSRIDPEVLIWLCMLVGAVCLAIQLLLSTMTKIPPLYSGIAILVAYAAGAAAIIIKARITIHQYTEMHHEITMNGAAMTDLIEQTDIPAVITHDDGTIIWYNSALRRLFGANDTPLFGKKMSRLCPFNTVDLINATKLPEDHDPIALAKAKAEGSEEKAEKKGGCDACRR